MKNIFILLCFCFIAKETYAQFNFKGKMGSEKTQPKILNEETKTTTDWESKRRLEILNLFKENVYGEFVDKKIEISFKVTGTDESALCGKAIRKNIIMCFSKKKDTVKADLLIYLPIKAKEQAAPLFLGMNFFGNHTIHIDENIPLTKSYVKTKPEINVFGNEASELSRGVRAYRWPIERIIESGYGLATIHYGNIDPDFDDGFKNGIHKLMEEPKKGSLETRSSISAWVWALSKAMDYFEQDSQINHNKIAVMGHSRLGKAALWAGATDKRFAITISNNSGCGGAALSRRKYGETVQKINASFPHWFCENFKTYNNHEELLPLDQHMLLSLIAPRGLYVASAEEDKWADPEGEYLSLYHATEIFKLYGLAYFTETKLPELNKPLVKTNIGYHIRSGQHNVTRFDWEAFINFANQFFNKH